MRRTVQIIAIALCQALVLAYFAACSTGIEGTKEIKLSRGDKRELAVSPEMLLMNQISSDSLTLWTPGKKFLVVDSKASLIIEPVASVSVPLKSLTVGDTIEYRGSSVRASLGNSETVVLQFSRNGHSYSYNTNRSPIKAASITGLDIPMIIDLDLQKTAQRKLSGRKLWLLTNLCYDDLWQPSSTEKFVPVSVDSIFAGNPHFPLRLRIKYENGDCAYLYMNVKSASGIGAESRCFDNLFSLSDPRKSHPSITDEVWTLICKGKLAVGMTKEECRLSLGNPSEVDVGHDWNSTIDIWRYKDGSFLRFEDGRLVDFRN